MKRYAIVGFGCAGYHALKALRQCDGEGEIHLWSEGEDPPANPMLTTYYAAGRLSYEGLFPFGDLEKITAEFRPVLHMGERITGLDAQNRTLIAGENRYGPFDGILLATGAVPVVPPLGVEVGNRVLCMRTVADAKLLRDRLDRGDVKSVTVIGGSMVGIKIVELCHDRGISCTLADMADRIFPLSAFQDVSAEIQRRLAEKGVTLRFGSAVTGAEERPDRVITSFAQGEPVESDLLVLCIGTRARMELAKEAGLETGRGILADDHMETSAPGIYAAGDCCQGRNVMTGERQIIGLWANAASQGTAAGRSMAGETTRFSGNMVHNITHFMGMDFISLGDKRLPGRHLVFARREGGLWLEATVDQGRLCCVNILDCAPISGIIKGILLKQLRQGGGADPFLLEKLRCQGVDEAFIKLVEGRDND